MKIGILGATCIAINTDQQQLDAILAHHRLLIGKNLTRGLGAGGQPEIGRAAAEESKNDLDNMLKDTDLGNHVVTGILINCINQLVELIPDDNIRCEIDSCISE